MLSLVAELVNRNILDRPADIISAIDLEKFILREELFPRIANELANINFDIVKTVKFANLPMKFKPIYINFI